jgi:LacI family transcriptional regulator
MRHATLKDVAELAGVSTTTVSRVLNHNGYVSAAARERVAAALSESGYRPNTVAQELRRQRTIALGLIMYALSNQAVAEIVAGAEHAAAEQDFDVLLYDTRGERERERRNVETLLRRRVDGIVFAGVVDAANLQLALDARVSVVELGLRVREESPAVVVDHQAAVRAAIEHLFALGHREIGYVGPPYHPRGEPVLSGIASDLYRVRFLAYQGALAAVGLPFDASYVVTDQLDADPDGVEYGALCMERLLEQAPALTAVFAASDILAAGVLQTLHRRGVSVPREMSVVAIDDTYARYLSPPLTSVSQHGFELGFQAATMAIELLADRTPGRTVTLESHLVVRESTAPPRGADPPALAAVEPLRPRLAERMARAFSTSRTSGSD